MSDIYKIAVKLTMESNAAAVLSVLSSKLLGVHADVKKLEGGLKDLNRIKLAVFGGLSIATGAGLLGLVKSTLDASKELNKQLTNTAQLVSNPKMSAATQAQALETARKTTRSVNGVGIDRAVEIFNETFSILGAAGAAKTNAALAKYAVVAGGTTGDFGKGFDAIRDLVKSGEMTGKIMGANHQVDPDKLLGYLDMATRVGDATGGRVNARTFFQLAQQGAPGLKNMTDEGMLGMLIASQQMGGFRAGTSVMSLFSQFAGGKMTQPVAEELRKLGLVGTYHQTGRGGALSWDKGALDTDFTRSLGKDPLGAIEILRKALTAHGITGEEQTKEIFKIFGRQTVQRLMNDLMTNMESMVAERGRIMNAQGLDQANKTQEDQSYDRNVHDLETAWHNLMAEVGNAATPAAIGVLQKMTGSIKSLTDTLVSMGPDKLRHFAEGIAIVGAALTAAGGVALIAALGPAGWIVLGIGALAAAVRAFLPDEFQKCIDGFKEFAHFNFGAVAKGIKDDLINGFSHIPDAVGGAIRQMAADLGKMLGDAIKGVVGSIRGFLHINYEGGGIGGDGFTPASFTEGGGIGGGGRSWDGRIGSLGGTNVGYGNVSKSSVVALIQKYATQEGVDPRVALAVANSEGLNVYTGDHGTSFGPYQLHYGGLADIFERTHPGMRVTDPRTIPSQIQFAMHWAKAHGWHDWHGAARIGVGEWQGLRGPGAPPRQKNETVIKVPVHIDGKVVANIVTKHQTKMASFPAGIHGGADDFGSYVGPGTTFQPA